MIFILQNGPYAKFLRLYYFAEYQEYNTIFRFLRQKKSQKNLVGM